MFLGSFIVTEVVYLISEFGRPGGFQLVQGEHQVAPVDKMESDESDPREPDLRMKKLNAILNAIDGSLGVIGPILNCSVLAWAFHCLCQPAAKLRGWAHLKRVERPFYQTPWP
jgi:hypothetical protein